jgi:hypothetical protein
MSLMKDLLSLLFRPGLRERGHFQYAHLRD